jgi:hypothetical protein
MVLLLQAMINIIENTEEESEKTLLNYIGGTIGTRLRCFSLDIKLPKLLFYGVFGILLLQIVIIYLLYSKTNQFVIVTTQKQKS